MKILHLLGDRKLPVNPDLEGTSGIVRTALELARMQVSRGHEVTLAVVSDHGWRSTWNGVHLVGLRKLPWASLRINGRTLDLRDHLPYMFFTWRHSFDILHGHSYSYMRFLRSRGHVVHFHSDPFYQGRKGQNLDLQPDDLSRIVRDSDIQITGSQFIARELERNLHGVGKVALVSYGIDALRFDAERWREQRLQLRHEWGVPENGIAFLYAGAIVPEKGVIHLARAFSQLAAWNPRLHLALAGASNLWGGELGTNGDQHPYEDEVRKALQSCTETGQVHFLGKVASSSMPMVYAACDILVMPSVWREAFGLVALEALATGRPVIATKVGGVIDFVNEENGLLVPPGEEIPLEHAMQTLAGDPNLRRRLGNSARAGAQRFSWSLAEEQISYLYQDLLANKT